MVDEAIEAVKAGSRVAIVIHTPSFANYVRSIAKSRYPALQRSDILFVTPKDIEDGRLRGIGCPTFWDHYARGEA